MKICPVCKGEMEKIGEGKDLPNIPFISIPDWIKESIVYECKKCGYIGIWHIKNKGED